jgi:hypothetical protein
MIQARVLEELLKVVGWRLGQTLVGGPNQLGIIVVVAFDGADLLPVLLAAPFPFFLRTCLGFLVHSFLPFALDEDHPQCLLAGGVVGGHVQEILGRPRLGAAEFVYQGLGGGPRKERTAVSASTMSRSSLHCFEKRCMYSRRVSFGFHRQPLRSQGLPWNFPIKISLN